MNYFRLLLMWEPAGFLYDCGEVSVALKFSIADSFVVPTSCTIYFILKCHYIALSLLYYLFQ